MTTELLQALKILNKKFFLFCLACWFYFDSMCVRLPADLGTNLRVRSHSRAPEAAARTSSGREQRDAHERHRAAQTGQDEAAHQPRLALSHDTLSGANGYII